jgi:hypothetical protein
VARIVAERGMTEVAGVGGDSGGVQEKRKVDDQSAGIRMACGLPFWRKWRECVRAWTLTSRAAISCTTGKHML